MAISRSKMNRQLREGGGIMNVASGNIGGGNYAGIPMGSRTGFGLLKKIGRTIRKVIPNEISKVAVKAAPFVAPFNPALAGAMAGIGSFDQTGNLGDAFKRGALTYGGGQAARYIGGAGFQQNPFTQGGAFTGGLEGFKGGFSSPLGTETGLGKLFSKPSAPVKEVTPIGVDEKAAEAVSKNIAETGMDLRELTMAGKPVPGADPGSYVSPLEYKQFSEPFGITEVTKDVVIKSEPKIFDLIKSGDYGQAAVEAGKKGLKAVFTNKDGSLDKTALLAAGSFGLTYLDAKKIADEAGEDIGTEEEYDEATKAAKKEEYAGYLNNFFGGKKDGGRIGYGTGSRPSQLFKLLEEAQAAGDDDKIKEIKLDLFREFGLKLAKGGRIGYDEGGRSGIIGKIADLFFDEEGNYSKALQRAKFEFSKFVSGMGTDLDTGAEWYNKLEPEEQKAIIEEKIKYRQRIDDVPLYDERYAGTRGIGGNYADGGRIGFNEGTPSIKLFPRARGTQTEEEVGPGFKISQRDIDYGITGLLQGDKFFGGAEIDKGKVKVDVVNPDGNTVFKDTISKDDAVNFILGVGDPKGNKFQVTTDDDFENMKVMLKKTFNQGGRVGFAGGTGRKSKYKPDIKVKQIDPLQQDFGFGGYKYKGGIGGGGSPFSKAAIAYLFRTLGKTGGPNRKYTMPNLYKILNNPGKFPKDEKALAAFLKIKGFKEGGRAELAMGSEVPVRKNKAGIEELDYRQSGGFVPIGVKEKADDVPAMLSKNEFVMTADAVRGIGDGSVERGAEKLYNVMKQAEKVGKA